MSNSIRSKKNKLNWFKDDKVQVLWAIDYLERSGVKIKLKERCSIYIDYNVLNYENIIKIFNSKISDRNVIDFIRVMSNAWRRKVSNDKDPRKNIQCKLSQSTFNKIKQLAKNRNCNNNELFEYLIDDEKLGVEAKTNYFENKIEKLKERHKKELTTLRFRYLTEGKVLQTDYDELKEELESTKKVLKKITGIINKLEG